MTNIGTPLESKDDKKGEEKGEPGQWGRTISKQNTKKNKLL